MQLIEVEPVGAQAAQRILDRLHDPPARAAALLTCIVHVHAEFRCQHDVLAPRTQHSAHVRFRATAATIHIRRVEQGNAGVDGRMDDRAGAGLIQLGAEIVAAEADGRHAQAGAAEIAEFHAKTVLCNVVR